LLKNGSEKCVTSSREHLYDLKSLETSSKVKNILEKTPDTKDNNIEFSDDEFENNAKPKFNTFSDEIDKNKIHEPNKVCFFSYLKYKKLK